MSADDDTLRDMATGATRRSRLRLPRRARADEDGATASAPPAPSDEPDEDPAATASEAPEPAASDGGGRSAAPGLRREGGRSAAPGPGRDGGRSAAPAPGRDGGRSAAPGPGRDRGRPQLFADSRLEDLVVITGYSGAGKSTAMAVFEDAGYFCVDNLPPEMIRALVELFVHRGSKVERAAVVSDVRGGDYFETFRAVLDDLAALGLRHRVLFLDADEQTLLTRYKETRRRHPAAPRSSVTRGVAAERAVLEAVKERADLVIDSTGLDAHALRRRIAEELLPSARAARLAVTLESFGFKHGPARDADLVLDVRFLPNPHYVGHLRPLTGHDPRVVAYIERDGRLAEFYERVLPLLDFLIPQYVAEGKAHLTIAIGCTGGRHRSVAIVEHLAARYAGRDDVLVEAVHRDADRASGHPDADLPSGPADVDDAAGAPGGADRTSDPSGADRPTG